MRTSPELSADEPKVHPESPDMSLAEEAMLLRREVVAALHRSGGGHYGSALSVLDILLTLFRRQLRVLPGTIAHPRRDRFILSKGHAAIALYAVMRRLGYFTHALDSYGSLSSPLEGHPDMARLNCLDFSTGSLGQGLSVGVGMAIALRPSHQRVWVVLGDGECQEGQVWEAALLAAQCGLDNLHVVVDNNGRQEWGWNATVHEDCPVPVPRLLEKFSAFGWAATQAKGHCFESLEQSLRTAAATRSRPSVVVANTVKGKGYNLIESDPRRFHCGVLTDQEHESLLGSPNDSVGAAQ